MKTVCEQFHSKMAEAEKLVSIVEELLNLGKIDVKKFRTSHAVGVPVGNLHPMISGSSLYSIVAYEGIFLSICAEFELCMRDSIERYIDLIVDKCKIYTYLPDTIRGFYPQGCAAVIASIDQDKFKHLSTDSIINSLVSTKKNKGFTLVPEVFSDNERNFKAALIDDIYAKRLGIKGVWKKIAREADMKARFSGSNEETVERLSKLKLDELIQKRNEVIHRGRSYYAPSPLDVRECIIFFKCLVSCIITILDASLAAA